MFRLKLFLILLTAIVGLAIALPAGAAPLPQLGDVGNDRYAAEIQTAVQQGIMAGFDDNTFRPQGILTREQLVSIVVESLKKVELRNLNLPFPSQPPSLPTVPTQITRNPFPDVQTSRWSAPKISYARELGLVRGYADGNFRPTQPVTRAELVTVLQQTMRYIVNLRGWSGQGFFSGEQPLNFSDTQNHWAEDTIRVMSANCRVASPLNETGTAFAPNQATQRNYAAAAIVRTVKCLNILPPPPS